MATPAFILSIISLAAVLPLPAHCGEGIPPVFIFGDSTADVGNNNFLQDNNAKANFLPYGIDLEMNSTGRFSNGLNTADFIAIKLGYKSSPPPFLSLTSFTEARDGINFASAGSGILETTGSIYGRVISMGKQIHFFETIRSNLTKQSGNAATDELLSKSIFFISTGSNDLFEAYGANHDHLNETQKNSLILALVLTYKSHLKSLYNLGARKFGVISIPPVGCCPSQRRLTASGGCLRGLNDASHYFHVAMGQILLDLSYELGSFKYALGNTYRMVISFLDHPLELGFMDVKAACCGGGRFNGESPCLPNSTFCSNRDEYLFWDLFHPTQAASKLAAKTLFAGSKKFVSPINFHQLSQI